MRVVPALVGFRVRHGLCAPDRPRLARFLRGLGAIWIARPEGVDSGGPEVSRPLCGPGLFRLVRRKTRGLRSFWVSGVHGVSAARWRTHFPAGHPAGPQPMGSLQPVGLSDLSQGRRTAGCVAAADGLAAGTFAFAAARLLSMREKDSPAMSWMGQFVFFVPVESRVEQSARRCVSERHFLSSRQGPRLHMANIRSTSGERANNCNNNT